MKILIDRDLCESNAICERFAPAVFEVDDDDELQVLIEAPGEEHREAVELAVIRCPRGAIELVAEG